MIFEIDVEFHNIYFLTLQSLFALLRLLKGDIGLSEITTTAKRKRKQKAIESASFRLQ